MNKAYEVQTQLHIKIQLKITYFCSILQTCWNMLLWRTCEHKIQR